MPRILPRVAKGTQFDAAALARAIETEAEAALLPLLHKHRAEDQLLHALLTDLSGATPRWRVDLQMRLPRDRIVTASGEGPEPEAAAAQAVRRLHREAKRHFDLLTDRKRQRRNLGQTARAAIARRIEALPAATAEASQVGIAPLLDRLRAVARRELAYLRATGDLAPDWPTLDDLVDEAAVATREAWDPSRPADKVWLALLRNLFKVLDRETAANRIFGQAVSLDDPVPEDARDQAEAMVEEEIHEFFQPDEGLILADVLPDAGVMAPQDSPAGDGETADEQSVLADVLKDLPVTWRRAWLMEDVEGMTADQIAEALGTSETTAQVWIAQAGAFVSARLGDAGITRHAGLRLTLHRSPASVAGRRQA
jgi:DNA-directed RNA polymerase specialized sigma24 family protein/ribosome-associated translation inhibitor RaiA